MSGLLDDFRSEFKKPNNTLVQLILVNTVVFLTVILIKVFAQVSRHPEVYRSIMDQLQMPWSMGLLIRKPWTVITYA